MNTLNIPGFTAEASLYRTSGIHCSVAVGSNSSGERRVVSQRRAGDGACYAALSKCWSDCSVWPEDILRYYCQDGCLTTFDVCTGQIRGNRLST